MVTMYFLAVIALCENCFAKVLEYEWKLQYQFAWNFKFLV